MAQTSVEWIFYAMQKTPMTDWYKVLEQSKAMHKADCINFAEQCNEKNMDSKEQLYDEIYKNK